MKKSILCLMALMFAAVAMAQDISTESAQQRATSKADYLRSTLQLDAKQYDKVYKAYLKFYRREDKRMVQSASERTSAKRSIESVLTQAQRAQFTQSNHELDPSPYQGLSPRPTRETQTVPLKRDPRRTNMIIEVE